MSRSMIKQQNSGATAHVVLYTPRQSTKKWTTPNENRYCSIELDIDNILTLIYVYVDNNSIVNQTKYTTHSTYEVDIVTIYIMDQTVHNTHRIVI